MKPRSSAAGANPRPKRGLLRTRIARTSLLVACLVAPASLFEGAAFAGKVPGQAPVLLPPSSIVAPGESVWFAPSQGSGAGFTFSFRTNASGATLYSEIGVYVAGPTGDVTDVVRLTDSHGGVATATITVTGPRDAPSAAPALEDANVNENASPSEAARDERRGRERDPELVEDTPLPSGAMGGCACTSAASSAGSGGSGRVGIASALGLLGAALLARRTRARGSSS